MLDGHRTLDIERTDRTHKTEALIKRKKYEKRFSKVVRFTWLNQLKSCVLRVFSYSREFSPYSLVTENLPI